MTAEAPVRAISRMKSPALRGFESSPFRVLRLSASTTTDEAARHAESALTLANVNLAPETPEPLPWLPPAEIWEMQQAAQLVEEPLFRLKTQLLWFDFARDPEEELLREALANPAGESVRAYLAKETGLGAVSADDPSVCNDAIARALNQANLRLLIAAAAANRCFTNSQRPGEAAIPMSKWTALGNFRMLAGAHAVLPPSLPAAAAGADWQGALQRWGQILTSPAFRVYVGSCIEALQDDFVSYDDAETIEESVRAHLADLAAQEARFFVMEGRYSPAASVIAAVAGSGMELRVIAPAMRPLRQVFQAEVAELDELLDGSDSSMTSLDAGLRRLDGIRARWDILDRAGVVGLRDMLDQALERAYLRLRKAEKQDPKLDSLLARITSLASAASLRERIKGYEKELEEARTRFCHFCKTGTPDYEKSVVLRGKKETSRSGNTVYYSLRYELVLRCEHCAKRHAFIRNLGYALWAALTPGAIALLAAMAGGSA